MSLRRRLRVSVVLAAVTLVVAPVVTARPAMASTGCDALNQPAADGFYFKGQILVSALFAGDVIRISAGLPVSASPTNYVPTGLYFSIGVFDGPPSVPVVSFPGTIVYTVPEDRTLVNLTWATTPEAFHGTEVASTWQVSCENAPKANPTLSTQASPATLLGGPVHDTATLSGATKPTGAIEFKLYGPDDGTCSGAAVFTTSADLAADGTATSPSFTPIAPGTYRWTASYAGDARNSAATSPCNAANESVLVKPFAPPPATKTLTGEVSNPKVGRGESVVITNANVVGPLTVEAGGAVSIVNTKVGNGIVVTNPSFLSICGSQIAAPSGSSTPALAVSGATVPIRIGDPAAGCAGNRFAGDVQLTGNSAGVMFGANVASRHVMVDNNTVGTSTIKGNTIIGTLGCAGNSPAPVNGGSANGAGSKTGQCSGL